MFFIIYFKTNFFLQSKGRVLKTIESLPTENLELIGLITNVKDQLDDKYELYKKELDFIVEGFEKNMLDLQKLYKNPLREDAVDTEHILREATVNATQAAECLTMKNRRMDSLVTEGNDMYEKCVEKAASEQLDAEMSMIAHEKNEFDGFVLNNLHSCKLDYEYRNCYFDLMNLVRAEMRRISLYMLDTLKGARVICNKKPKDFGVCTGNVVRRLFLQKQDMMEGFKDCLESLNKMNVNFVQRRNFNNDYFR